MTKQPWIGSAVAAAVTFSVAPLVKPLMERANVMDVPNARSSHAHPVPRGGGVAIWAGMLAGRAMLRAPLERSSVAVAILGLTGLADDVRSSRGGVSVSARLSTQIAAGALMGAKTGLRGSALGAIVAPCVVNVVNFMDGINGMTGLTSAVWGVHATQARSPDATFWGAAVGGSGIGFLPWNAPQARLFLGDSGSYALGGAITAGVLEEYHATRDLRRAAFIAAPLLPYAVDAAVALAKRHHQGHGIGQPHRGHVYQRLVDEHQIGHTSVAMAHATVSCVVAVMCRTQRPRISLSLAALAVGAYMASPRWMAWIKPSHPQ
ncbi:hypothetical protein ACOCJ4_04595 [Knoellia sp. CPCC 206435]|uniref:hypothetical protein n=1 Tax=Knoellia terrae TaxID=3404797 RepID=UPI003B4294CF